MNDHQRDQGIEQISEGHAEKKLSTAENRDGRVQEIVLEINDKRIVKQHGFESPYHDQGQEKQQDDRDAVFLIQFRLGHFLLFCSGVRKT